MLYLYIWSFREDGLWRQLILQTDKPTVRQNPFCVDDEETVQDGIDKVDGRSVLSSTSTRKRGRERE